MKQTWLKTNIDRYQPIDPLIDGQEHNCKETDRKVQSFIIKKKKTPGVEAPGGSHTPCDAIGGTKVHVIVDNSDDTEFLKSIICITEIVKTTRAPVFFPKYGINIFTNLIER